MGLSSLARLRGMLCAVVLFAVVELVVGNLTKSLALVADRWASPRGRGPAFSDGR